MVEKTKKEEPKKEIESRRGDFTPLGTPQLEEEAQARKIDTAGKNRSQVIGAIVEYDALSPEEQEERQSAPKVKVEVVGGGIRGDEVDVVDKNSNYIRTYCKKSHGAGFMELAKQFITSIPTTPDENKGRQLIPHNDKIKEAVLIDRKGEVRKSFTKEVNGIHFREMALAIKGLPEMVINNRGEKVERTDNVIPVHVEYR